jgi:membrane protein implicated in regulation of membrane protease activity
MSIIETIVTNLGPWSWWVLGILLAAVEVVAPGTFFIWFALAALVVGTVALTQDVSWQTEVLLFLVLAVAAAIVGRRFYGNGKTAPEDGIPNDRINRLVGRAAILDTAISSGTGHIKLDDTLWRVEGPELPAGARVRITGYRNGRLQVEAETV